MMPIPNGPTLFVSEYERVVSFHHFPRENEIGSVLLHLRADEGEFIPFAKPYTHVVEERLRAEIYVDGVRAIFHEQCMISFSLPFGGTFSSSTVPLNLASV